MSPDRLAELRRQRALVAQHLAWIDAELTAAGSGQATTKTAPPPPPLPAHADSVPEDPAPAQTTAGPVAAAADPAVALANARADEIIEKYRATEALDPAATKRGCLVLFGALFVLGGAAILAIYYFGYARN